MLIMKLMSYKVVVVSHLHCLTVLGEFAASVTFPLSSVFDPGAHKHFDCSLGREWANVCRSMSVVVCVPLLAWVKVLHHTDSKT